MPIYFLAFVGGVLTILSPCILPVLPFVFARADQPFRRSGLPLLVGMALTFSAVAIAAAFGGHWVVRLNQGGRYVANAGLSRVGCESSLPFYRRSIDSSTSAGGRQTVGWSVCGKRDWKVLCVGDFDGTTLGSVHGPDSWFDINRFVS
jgi:cytochrome c biogenesis protein CcdA